MTNHAVKQTGINDFYADLEYSLESSMADFWDAVYRKAFIDLDHTEICTELDWQRKGVDRVVYLSSGHSLHIDEKCRRTVYPDILLEYVSNDTIGSLGWMEKDLAIDYLAYAFMPIQTVYLFPWPLLRRTWQHFRNEWLEKYPKIPAQNIGYTTWSLAIPTKVLREKVNTASVIKLEKIT